MNLLTINSPVLLSTLSGTLAELKALATFRRDYESRPTSPAEWEGLALAYEQAGCPSNAANCRRRAGHVTAE
jgi:hypothetical protein